MVRAIGIGAALAALFGGWPAWADGRAATPAGAAEVMADRLTEQLSRACRQRGSRRWWDARLWPRLIVTIGVDSAATNLATAHVVGRGWRINAGLAWPLAPPASVGLDAARLTATCEQRRDHRLRRLSRLLQTRRELTDEAGRAAGEDEEGAVLRRLRVAEIDAELSALAGNGDEV